ncbi:MAG: NAD-dependent epimerase/dehydratase family protein [Bacteroidota bacterium]
MKKILITGAAGFIGRNLIEQIQSKFKILPFDKENNQKELENFIKESDCIVHLAGSNRPTDVNEYKEVNFGLTEILTELLKKHSLQTPIIFSSSTQAELDNPYGESKKNAENLLIEFAKENNSDVFILRLTNVFGKWGRPNYNSVVATFCYNIANEIEVKVNDANAMLKLIHVDDVTNKIIELINFEEKHNPADLIEVEPYHNIMLGQLKDLIYSFKNKVEVNFEDKEFVRKLRSTYEAYEAEV